MATSSREEVARRAYELFLSRGAGHGRDLDDWLEAERQLAVGIPRRASGASPRRRSAEATRRR
jgi:hypothetical protein